MSCAPAAPRAAQAGSRGNIERQTRAEEHLDALLEYRHAARDQVIASCSSRAEDDLARCRP